MPDIVSDTISNARLDFAGQALLCLRWIGNAKGDRGRGRSRDVPHTEGPVICSAVERIVTVILLGCVCLVVKRIGSFANASDITSGDGVVNRMTCVLG